MRKCPFQTLRVADSKDGVSNGNLQAIANFQNWRSCILNSEKDQVMLSVNANDAFDVVFRFLADKFCVTPRRFLDDMEIRHNHLLFYKKSAAERHRLASFVLHHQQYDGWKSCTRNLPRVFYSLRRRCEAQHCD